MLRFAVFALLVAASSALSVSPARNPFIYHKGVRAPVEGLVPCPADGEVTEVRLTGCTFVPCAVIIGTRVALEVDFKPAATHTTLTVEIYVVKAGDEVEVVHEEIRAVVSPGNGYTLAYPWVITNKIPLGFNVLRMKLTGDGVVELCGLLTVQVTSA